MSANKFPLNGFLRRFSVKRGFKAPHLRLIHRPEQTDGASCHPFFKKLLRPPARKDESYRVLSFHRGSLLL